MRRKKIAKALAKERSARDSIDQMVLQQTKHLSEAKAELELTQRRYRAHQRAAKSRIRRLERQRFQIFKVATKRIKELERQVAQLQPTGDAHRNGHQERSRPSSQRSWPARDEG
jgi:hypothetical protein